MAQNVFITPDIKGFLNDNAYNARSEALGKNTITLDGIKTAFENPAVLSSSNEKLSLGFNYDKGHYMYPKSYYITGGVSYRINDRIVVGFDTRHWIDPEPYWRTIIGSQAFSTDKNTFNANSIMVAGKIIEGLHVGASVHFMNQKEIDNNETASQTLASTGVVYDRAVNWIKNEKFQNQKIRGAVSLFNTLMKGSYTERANDSVFGFRDIPIILRIGTSYSFSHPINLEFAKNSKLLKDAPQKLDVSLHLQYSNWLASDDHIFTSSENHTMVGVGVEGTALNTLALRLGYFTETRGTDVDPGEIAVTKNRRKAFTWGLGFILPVHKWSNNGIPFETRLDILAKGLPDVLNENRTERVHPDFTDDKLQLSIGLQLNLKSNTPKNPEQLNP
ncbi:hypothetical protein [Flagellimonas nanhaiensis]|uniref:Aromatic hydrocarbon degradation protein n=1 Tax=Flagellimonas nanhaiensis TaxID=2292706 RepID=A0A371JRN5_9FLAO|nr:hypothetical protein [Allomuricauda nanhaiensis]RDY60164.1 hypothetical protein DX873_12605 [Allomuricauda nanhaiensis]